MIRFYDATGQGYLGQATIKRSTGVNGSISLSGTIFAGQEVIQGIDYGWRLFFDDQYFAVTYKKLNDQNKTVEFDAIQQFFWDFSKTSLYTESSGSHTFAWYLGQLFQDSGYTYDVQDTVLALEKDNWGMKNKLDLFNDIIKQADVEFEVSNKNIIIRQQIGSDLTGIVRQGINLSNLIEETDISNFATYIKGYGKYVDENDHSKGRLEVEYTSPLATVYGKLEMDPYVNESFAVASSFKVELKNRVDATYSVSLKLDIYDLKNAGYSNIDSPQVGDWIMAIDESLNFRKRIRIIKVDEEFDSVGKRIGYTATCGDLSSADSYQSSLNQLADQVEQVQKNVTIVQVAANGKNKIYRGPDDPRTLSFNNLIEGDEYWQKNGDKVTVWMWNGTRWEDIIDDATGEEVKKAVEESKQETEAAKALAQSGVDKANVADINARQGIKDAAEALGQAHTVSEEVTQLKGGSTVTLAQLEDGLKQTITSGEFESYRAQTAKLIQDKVSSSEFESFRSQTANALQDRVTSTQFESVRTQLDDQITSVVKTQTAENTNLIVNGAFKDSDYWRIEAGTSVGFYSEMNDVPISAGTYIRTIDDSANYSVVQRPSTAVINALRGKTVTVSIYGRASGTSSDRFRMYIRTTATDGSFSYINSGKYYTINNGWQRFSFTAVLPTDITAANITFNMQELSGVNVYLTGAQLNLSDQLLPYSESIEDFASRGQITVLTDAVNARVETDKLINQINISREGILIDGAKTHITNRTTIDNAVIKSAMIDTIKADQITTGKLNAANVDIINMNADNIVTGSLTGIKLNSADGKGTFSVQGDYLAMSKNNGDNLVFNNSGIYWKDRSGNVLFEVSNKMTTSDIFGTAEYNVYLASDNETRSVTYKTALTGSGGVNDYKYVNHRAAGIYANFLERNTGDGSGGNIYLRPLTADDEVRVTASGGIDSYAKLRARYVYADRIINNGAQTDANHLYLMTHDEVQVKTTNDNVDKSGYMAVRASAFNNGSLAEYKQNIQEADFSALAEINKSTIYDYQLKTSPTKNEVGLVIGDNYDISDVVVDGDGVNQYRMTTVAWKAIQELSGEVNELKTKIKQLKGEAA